MIDAHSLLSARTRELIAEAREALHHGVVEKKPSTIDETEPAVAEGQVSDPDRDPAEAVHDLRVAIRRLRSVLRPMRLVYGKNALRKTELVLGTALDITSDLRDDEVLRETLERLDVGAARERLSTWMQGRARREHGTRLRAIRSLLGTNGDGKGESSIAHGLDRLERKVDAAPEAAADLDTFERQALTQAMADLEERVEASKIDDAMAMHRVRIGAKRLRYVAELLADLSERPAAEGAHAAEDEADASGEGRERSPRVSAMRRIEKGCERIQKRLGTLHDLDEALLRMGRAWGLDRGPREEVLTALRRARSKLARKSQAELTNELSAIRGAYTRVLESFGLGATSANSDAVTG